MEGISKRFGPNVVLENVSLELRRGEVHVLAGENGAGKSTLIKILAGVYRDFQGRIAINGREVRLQSPSHANQLGIAVIHQELSLIGSMSVADNLFLGHMPCRAGFVQDRLQQQLAVEWLGRMGLDLDPSEPVERFPIATQQLIEIAKALGHKAQVLVMDEPTSALNAPEVERLFELIAQLKADGVSIVYISHKLEEIERLADRITVLRDGKYVGTATAAELPPAKMIQWMVGREIGEQIPRRSPHLKQECFEVKNLSVFPNGREQPPTVSDVSFSVQAGEILGLAGLEGSGASDLLLGLFGGYGSQTWGQVRLAGEAISPRSPRQALDAGVALLTSDRQATGLVLTLSIVANTTLAALPRFTKLGWRRAAHERNSTQALATKLHLRAMSLDMNVGDLSGGNQQKVMFAKCLEVKPRVLMLDEPTRGIDVAAKREIYRLIDDLTDEGLAILLITSEMPELLALSDRVLVLHRGRATAHFNRDQATPEKVLAAAMGQGATALAKKSNTANSLHGAAP